MDEFDEPIDVVEGGYEDDQGMPQQQKPNYTTYYLTAVIIIAIVLIYYFYLHKQGFSLYSYIDSKLPYNAGANMRYMSIDSSTAR